MDICGEARVPGRKHLLELAAKTGIKEKKFPIRERTIVAIEKAVPANCERLAKETT